jgi:hypothetical protein
MNWVERAAGQRGQSQRGSSQRGAHNDWPESGYLVMVEKLDFAMLDGGKNSYYLSKVKQRKSRFAFLNCLTNTNMVPIGHGKRLISQEC